jgi:hypothetical protein
MSPSRVARCTRSEALVRLQHAKSFLEVAERILGPDEELRFAQVSASLAVLSGIATSDAVCCARLGQRSRGQDHRQALALLGSIPSATKTMEQDLRRLFDIKDGAQYSSIMVTVAAAKDAVRRARRLYEAGILLVK